MHIFRDKRLLSRLSLSDTTLHLGGVVKGHVLETREVGSFLDIAHHCVWYSNESVANILSFHLLESDGHSPFYDRERKVFVVQSPEFGDLEFPWDEHAEHYVCDFEKHLSKCRRKTLVCHTLATIADNESQYPKRVVKAARRARELIARLGFPSTGKLAELINSGNLTNEVVSVQDVERSLDIYGASVPSLKGKTQKRKPTQIPLEIPRKVVRGPLAMHIDIIFVRATPYLLTVTTPLGYIMCDVLSAAAAPLSYEQMEPFVRSTKAIRRSLLMMLNRYRAHNFAVSTILSDNEGGVTQMDEELSNLGCHVIACGPGQHIALVEHKAKLVKQRRRCHLYHVPFAIPILLEMYLVYHCVYTLNCMPTATRGDHVAPQVDFLGRKLDSARDVRFVWGDLCQAHNPDNIITNSDKARTDTCVLLLSTANLNGSVKMLNLATWRVVTRDQWTVIPYDTATIQQLTARALKDEVALSSKQREAYRAKDAVFRRIYQPLTETLDYEETPAMVMPTESPPVLHREATVESPDVETQDRPSPVIDQPVVTHTGDQRGVSTSDESDTADSTPNPRNEQVNTPVPPVPPTTAAPESEGVPLVPPTTTTAPSAPSVDTPEIVETPAPPVHVPRYNLRERKTPRITEAMAPKSRGKTATVIAAQHPRRILSFATRARFFEHSKRVRRVVVW